MTSTVRKFGVNFLSPAIVACTLLFFSTSGFAAEYPVRGTIQALQQDGGVIRISGRDLNYQDGVVSITLNGEEMEPQFLTEGMVVRYTLTANGYLGTIVIIGPESIVGNVDDN